MKKALHEALQADVHEPTLASVVARLAVLAGALMLWVLLARTTHDAIEHAVTSTLAMLGLASTISLLESARRYLHLSRASRRLRKGELMSLLVVLADDAEGSLTLAVAARSVQQQCGPIALTFILDALAELSAQGLCTTEYNDDGNVERWQFSRSRLHAEQRTPANTAPQQHDA